MELNFCQVNNPVRELEDFRRPNSLQATWECVVESLTSGEQP